MLTIKKLSPQVSLHACSRLDSERYAHARCCDGLLAFVAVEKCAKPDRRMGTVALSLYREDYVPPEKLWRLILALRVLPSRPAVI